ncbi:MAG TPA: SOS response-associated peptidase [Burkholderiales bacterium]|nr:SOS response-associated peptidase [Burkholderiales bacterium]
MCGRYALHANPDVVALQFGLDARPEFGPRYNIAPATEILVVRNRKAGLARWNLRGGFVNLRAETVRAKFKRSGRCLVPASGFYEWKSEGGRKQPYYFFPKNEPLFGFAALWEHETCSLITTEPNEVVRKAHDRMPLIVPPESYAAWLAGDEGLLENQPQIAIVAHPVGLAVNTAANDSRRLIEPVELARGLFD